MDEPRITLGGYAVVVCPHGREKNLVRDADTAVRLGAEHGYRYNPDAHRFHTCGCCGNVFVVLDDEPRPCGVCSGVPLETLETTLPSRKGGISL